MTLHDKKPAGRDNSPFSKPEDEDQRIPSPRQTYSGKRVLMNWLLMIGGFCAIALGAQFVIG